jgi:NAD+ synthase
MVAMKAPEQRIILASMDPTQVADEIGGFILHKVLELKKTGGVLGLSGGVDSTCVAALAKRAFDRHNTGHPQHPLEVVGYLLPSKTNHPKDVEDGLQSSYPVGDPP